MFQIKRAYEKPTRNDGKRVLVDRLWPRGLRRESASLDVWMSSVAPSDRLRRWFGHEPARWPEFRRRYLAELKDQREDLAELARLGRTQTVTLVFGARDTSHNQAVVLRDLLRKKRRPRSRQTAPTRTERRTKTVRARLRRSTT